MSNILAKPPKHKAPALATNADGSAGGKDFYELLFPGSADKPFEIKGNGATFQWTPTELVYKDETDQYDYIVGSSPSSLNVMKNQVRYARTFPDADDFFNVEGESVKHWTILNEPPRAQADYLTGKIYFGVSGLISGLPLAPGVYDHISTDAMTLPKPIVKDVAGSQIEGFYEVVDSTSGQQLFIWFDASFLDNAVYPVMIDPTVVVNSAYSTAGNGGRKTGKLSNGWLVASVADKINTTYPSSNSLRLYKSTDNGSTWTALTTGTDSYFSGEFSLISQGTFIYITLRLNKVISALSFDATTIGTTIELNYSASTTDSTVKLDDTSTVDVTGMSIIVNSTGTELHATWSCKNSTYPNSFNIRYAKGTIDSTGSVTWGAVQQVTAANTSGNDNTNPSIVVKSDGFPYIFEGYNDPTYNRIAGYNYDGSSWSFVNVSGTFQGYTQNNPSAISIPSSVNGLTSGRIWVAWHGLDATDTTYNNIRVSYSDDGGATWSAMQKITTGNTYNQQFPSISYDLNNKIYVHFQGRASGSYDQIRRITNTSGTWSAVTDLTSNTTAHNQYPAAMEKEVGSMLGFIWQDNQAVAVQFDKLVFNQPPNAPSLKTRSNFDAADQAMVEWTYSDPDSGDTQSAYQLQSVRVSDSVVVVDTGKVASTTSSHTLAGATLTNPNQYQWRVKTWDSAGAEGPYSAYESFYTSAKPSASITNPATDGDTVSESRLTAQWSFSDPESEGQSAYQVKLTDATNTVLWDSGKTSSTSARSKTIDYDLANSTDYKVKVTVWDAKDVQSIEVVRTFTVSFTPPATPTITTSKDAARGSLATGIDNGAWPVNTSAAAFTGTGTGTMTGPTSTNGVTDTHNWEAICVATAANGGTFDVKVDGSVVGQATVGTQFSYEGLSFTINDGATDFALNDKFTWSTTAIKVSYNNLYRRKQGDSSWTRIATNIAVSGIFTDYTPKYGQVYDYYVRTQGDNGTYSDSATVSDSVTFNNAQLALVADFTEWIELVFGSDRTEGRRLKRDLMQFAGRQSPVAEFGDQFDLGLNLSYQFWDAAELQKLIDLADSKQTLLYRDNRGRREFVTIDAINIKDEKPNYWSVSLNPSRVFFEEGV